jgi:hypothetical protein
MRTNVWGLALVCLVVATNTLSAHQPRYPVGQDVRVQDPGTSQAFYGELQGQPALYHFALRESLLLYVGVLVPDIPNIHKDFSAELRVRLGGHDSLLQLLDGARAQWSVFHEPVANDDYFQGPEFRRMVGPGEYEVEVSRPANRGKYVLAIGEAERFTVSDFIRIYGMLPRLKRDYFGKPAWTAYFNYTGIGLGVAAVVVAGVALLVVSLARR